MNFTHPHVTSAQNPPHSMDTHYLPPPDSTKCFWNNHTFKTGESVIPGLFVATTPQNTRDGWIGFLVDKSLHAHTVSCRSHQNPVNSDHRCIFISVNLPRKWFRKATKKPHKPRIPKPNYSLLTSDPDIRLKYQ